MLCALGLAVTKPSGSARCLLVPTTKILSQLDSRVVANKGG